MLSTVMAVLSCAKLVTAPFVAVGKLAVKGAFFAGKIALKGASLVGKSFAYTAKSAYEAKRRMDEKDRQEKQDVDRRVNSKFNVDDVDMPNLNRKRR